ncbi:HTH-10 family transcription regulator (plasmid) [Natrialba magadii ATCC 43099]|uniref:Bacterio-opsin activator HTH domain-containing protein n=1 Tax=Natrialba magadii (strain ATCC 43099 / DSM 3394 / CCM 3739 / CIP 104546 / IAM 13178 / JCM 8861 / NBRC 102185 / NCIMB 2190 / MS3) TaxID=547559 RepID=D3T270_NATMM|nr:helix-turn-helix domain-containing protein [Natrialba magadii]ADD07679.1 HTH-10 family transcription regulator [Natrialba magadii ATCC 43099]ELY26489.1 bacterio-opsin activator HTH domain-containing protein [Natrialba magadii ATCC 43099]
MKQIRVQLTLDPNDLPPFYSIVSDSPDISELQLVDWNLAADDIGTIIYVVDGDEERFRDALDGANGIVTTDVTKSSQGWSYAVVKAKVHAIPLFDTLMELVGRAGMIVRKPIVIDDNCSHARIVGEPESLQSIINDVPSNFELRVDRIESFPGEVDAPEQLLSDRQQEVVSLALEMGYYDQPRGTTHAEIAAKVGCAPNTVTMHLQKAEAKLIPATMNHPGA